jgi:hypothetical protein
MIRKTLSSGAAVRPNGLSLLKTENYQEDLGIFLHHGLSQPRAPLSPHKKAKDSGHYLLHDRR